MIGTARMKPKGEIILPLAGTIHWVNGKSAGVWGKELKIIPMMRTTYGLVRPLNVVERQLYRHLIEGFAK